VFLNIVLQKCFFEYSIAEYASRMKKHSSICLDAHH
jgi:hypothetical protein